MDRPNFESPFTWDIGDEFISNFDESELDMNEGLPFFNFMHSLMATFIYARKEDYNAARNNFQKMDTLWSIVDRDQLIQEQVSIDTVNHIVQSTKYHVLLKLEHFLEESFSLEKLKPYEPSISVVSISTLNGCKSIAWSVFYESAMANATTFARLASIGNPKCSMWHFMLGKNLRRFRRDTAFSSNPSQEEINSFIKAYNIYRNPMHGIYVAQVYGENSEFKKSQEIYVEVFNENLRNVKIQLRLALCFLRDMDLAKAKLCLDFVEQCSPESAMYLHYRGKYYVKQNNYESAVIYLKKAANCGIFGADIEYGQCMAKIDTDFDHIIHLLLMAKKFKNNKVHLQNIYLHLGMEYYYIEKYEKSLKYIELAVKLIPNSKTLQRFYYKSYKELFNIFEFINTRLIPEYESTCDQDLPLPSRHYIEEIKNIHTKVLLELQNSSTDKNIETFSADSEANVCSRLSLCTVL